MVTPVTLLVTMIEKEPFKNSLHPFNVLLIKLVTLHVPQEIRIPAAEYQLAAQSLTK